MTGKSTEKAAAKIKTAKKKTARKLAKGAEEAASRRMERADVGSRGYKSNR